MSLTKIWNCLVALVAIVTLVATQCVNNHSIEIFVDGQLWNSTTATFHLFNNEQFIVGCRKCNINKKAPNWFYPNHTAIQGCNNGSEMLLCTQTNGTIKYLEFLSFQESLIGEYKCTSKGKIDIKLAVSISFNQSVYIVNEDDGFIQAILVLSNSVGTNITIQVGTNDNTATGAGDDYNSGPYNVTFPAGVTDVSLDVTINKDTILERNEIFMLTLANLSLSDQGFIFTTGDHDKATVTIVDSTKLAIVASSRSKAWYVNTTATLSCKATASGNISYQWRRVNEQITSDRTYGVNTSTLTLSPVTERDEGQYYCVATYDTVNGTLHNVTSNNVTITVYGPPVVKQLSISFSNQEPPFSPVYYITSGIANCKLHCCATNDPQSPTKELNFGWYKDSAPIRQNDLQFIIVPIPGVGSDLLIGKVDANLHNGTYTCSAYEVANNRAATQRATLIVETPTMITTHPHSRNVSIGETVTLSCEATGSDPIRYQWRRVDGEIISNSIGVSTSTMTILSVMKQDENEYYCIASNGGPDGLLYNDTSNKAMVTVYVVEIIEPSMDFHSIILNDTTSSLQLMCSLNIIISSNVTVTWLHNGNPVMTASPNDVIQTDNTTTLLIGNFQPSDAGIYQCLFNDTFNKWLLRRNINITLKELSATIKFNKSVYSTDEGSELLQPVLILSNPLLTNVTVQVISIDYSATGDTDFTSGPYNITFPTGETIMSFNILITDDIILETDEKFELNIDNNSLPNILTTNNLSKTIVFITDNDISTVSFHHRFHHVHEQKKLLQPMLILSNPSSTNVTVYVIDAVNTANRSDYGSGRFQVTFPTGETRISFNVTINDDNIMEEDENFFLIIDIDSLPNGITIGRLVRTIVTIKKNDNAHIQFNESRYHVEENGGQVQPVLILSNQVTLLHDIVVTIRSIDKTATGDDDYNPGPYNITFHTGVTYITFNISINNDNISEEDEEFNLIIEHKNNSTFLGHNEITVIIKNDDIGIVRFNESVYSINEGNGVVHPVLVLSNPSSANISVVVMDGNSNNTATGGGIDYYSGPYNITFPAYMTIQTFSVQIIDDKMLETNESFDLNIIGVDSPYANVASISKSTTITIIDDEKAMENESGGSSDEHIEIAVGVTIGLIVIMIMISFAIFIFLYNKNSNTSDSPSSRVNWNMSKGKGATIPSQLEGPSVNSPGGSSTDHYENPSSDANESAKKPLSDADKLLEKLSNKSYEKSQQDESSPPDVNANEPSEVDESLNKSVTPSNTVESFEEPQQDDLPFYIFPPDIDYRIGCMKIFTVTDKREEFNLTEEDITITVPNEAIPIGKKAIMLLSVSLTAPINFPSDVAPVSAILWLCMNLQPKKPITLKMPHFLNVETEAHSQNLRFVSSNSHDETVRDMVVINGGIFPVNKSYGVLNVNRFCYHCITQYKKASINIPDHLYQVAIMMKKQPCISSNRWKIDVCILPDLPFCLQTLSLQYNKEWERKDVLQKLSFINDFGVTCKLKAEKKFKIIPIAPDRTITKDDIDFKEAYNDTLKQDELLCKEMQKIYPPRFQFEVLGTNPNAFTFEGFSTITYQIRGGLGNHDSKLPIPSYSGKITPSTDIKVAEEIFNQKPLPRVLRVIQVYFVAKWKDIGVQVIEQTDINVIDIQPQKEEEKCYQMLLKWLETDHNATYNKLFKVLQMYKFDGIVADVKKNIITLVNK